MLQEIVKVIGRMLSSLGYIGMLLFLVLFIFSVLGIYSNNKWGLKTSILSSTALPGARSRVVFTDSGKICLNP